MQCFAPSRACSHKKQHFFNCIPFLKCWLLEVLHCTCMSFVLCAVDETHSQPFVLCAVDETHSQPFVLCAVDETHSQPFVLCAVDETHSQSFVLCASQWKPILSHLCCVPVDETHSPKLLHVNVRRCVQSLIRYSRSRYRHACYSVSQCLLFPACDNGDTFHSSVSTLHFDAFHVPCTQVL